MKRTLVIALAIGIAACSDPDVPYPGHRAVLEAASSSGPVELSRLWRSANKSGDPDRIYVAALVAYIVDSLRFEERFVAAFPPERAMAFIIPELEEPRLTPSYFYSFAELSRIALAGNQTAITKLVATAAVSDGPLRTILCDAFVLVISDHGERTLNAIGELDPERRPYLYACLAALSAEQRQAVEDALELDGGTVPFVASELRDQLDAAPPGEESTGR